MIEQKIAPSIAPFRSPLGQQKDTRVIRNLEDWFKIRETLKGEKKTIGFVPTMGALHSGHAELLRTSSAKNDISILSIYVNPTQFDNQDDLAKYPSTLDHDVEVAKSNGVDFVLLPTYQQIYPDQFRYKVIETDLSRKLCGAHRPGHFDGVLSVVLKLLNIVQPDRAYLGEKDQQQLQLIKGMVTAFFLPVNIISCPTVREQDGLAMSSRNVRLDPSDRKRAPLFYEVLQKAPSAEDARNQLKSMGFEIDYIEDIDGHRYGAVKLGSVRLIDNVQR